MKQGQYLYTVVCRYYTIQGIVELDLFEVFRRLRIKPYNTSHGLKWDYYRMIREHVYTAQAVEYVIKKVLRNVSHIRGYVDRFYSPYSPYSIMYDCMYDLKDVENMNNLAISLRMEMSDEDFNRIYGGKKY